jgi:hypothetical protein
MAVQEMMLGRRKMKAIFRTFATIAALATNAAAAENADHSANYFLPSCKNFINGDFGKAPFDQGHCVGLIEGISVFANQLPTWSWRACVPDDVTVHQVTTVVVRWLEARPQLWHRNFKALALQALSETWPCK